MSINQLAKQIDDINEEIMLLKDIKKDTEDPAALKELNSAIDKANSKIAELKDIKNVTTPCTDENDIME